MGYLTWIPVLGFIIALALLPVRIELEARRSSDIAGALEVRWLLPGRARLRLGFVVRCLHFAWRRAFGRLRVEVEAPGISDSFSEPIDTERAKETTRADKRPIRAFLLGLKAVASFVQRSPSNIGSPALAWMIIPSKVALLALRRCERLDVRIRVGTGDAAAISLLLGTLWGAIMPLVGAFAKRSRLDETPNVHLEPDYEEEAFEFSGLCILNFSLGQFMVMALQSVWRRWIGTAR